MAFQPKEIEDVLADFGSGVNSDPPPLKLNRDQLSSGVNLTLRGLYARPRPPFNNIQLDAASDVITSGLFQAAIYYKPDAGPEFLLLVVAGNLYRVDLDGTVTQVNDGSTTQNALAPQHWLWQAERWVIWNDGINLPVFFDGTSCTRSSGLNTVNPAGTYTGSITAVVSSTDPNYANYQTAHLGFRPSFVLTVSPAYTGTVGDLASFNVETLFLPNPLHPTEQPHHHLQHIYVRPLPVIDAWSLPAQRANRVKVYHYHGIVPDALR